MSGKKLSPYYLVMVFAASAICFAGYKACAAENDTAREEPAATVEIVIAPDSGARIDAKVDTVKAKAYSHFIKGKNIPFIVAKAPFANGKATLHLSDAVPAAFLAPVKDYFKENVTVSDTTVRGISFSSFSAYKSGSRSGHFSDSRTAPESPGYLTVTVEYWYVDGDVAINGSWDKCDEEWSKHNEVDIRLKKGWNAVYLDGEISETDFVLNMTLTNIRPDGMKWYFIEY